jgi:integrase/recombinase XerD
LSEFEMTQLLEYVGQTRYAARNRAILLLTHLAGLRVGEAAALRWGDILTAEGQVRKEFRLTAVMTKGGKARTVYVSQKLMEALCTYAAGVAYKAPDAALFPSQKQRRAGFTANSLAQTLKGLYVGAGIDQASSHSGRRTFLTNLADRGVPIHVLANLAGHRNISTTSPYLFASPRHLRSAVNLLDLAGIK